MGDTDKFVKTISNLVAQNAKLKDQLSKTGIKRGIISGSTVSVNGCTFDPIWAVDDNFIDGDNVCVIMSDDGRRAVVVGRW